MVRFEAHRHWAVVRQRCYGEDVSAVGAQVHACSIDRERRGPSLCGLRLRHTTTLLNTGGLEGV
jgi:hypothetical protein